MSKSLGNVFTVRDVLDRGYRASALRYLLMSVQYRKQLRFSWATLDQAEEAVKRLSDFLARVDVVRGGGAHEAVASRLAAARADFAAHVRNDLNVPGAMGVVFDLVRALNSAIDAGEVGEADVSAVKAAFDEFDRILGVIALRRREEAPPPVAVDEIERLIAARQAARRQRDFAASDRIRADLDTRSIVLEDTAAGTAFVRAQWAARPFVWLIYPTEDAAHWVKLGAFRARYTAGMDRAHATRITALWEAWNRGDPVTRPWPAFDAALPAIAPHAEEWAERLAARPDLATALANFAGKVLK